MRVLRRHASTIVVAFVTAAVTAGGPVIAASFDASNADKVDGRHAVGARAKPAARAGKLVATNGKGRLPNNIIAKAPDANRLDGLDSTALQRRAARTVYVAPGATPKKGGARLRAALASIPAQGTIGSPWPSPGERWTVKLEPGVYDLDGAELATRSHVDIEGAGPRHTVLTCDCVTEDPDTAAVVHLKDDSELRALTVRNEPTPSGPHEAATGVRMDSGQGSVRDIDVFVGPTGKSTGLRVHDATLRVWTARVDVETLGGGAAGVWGTSSQATVYISGSEVRAPAGYAFRSSDGAVGGGGTASARIVSSLLEGIVQTSTTKCVGAYTADYAARTANCGTS